MVATRHTLIPYAALWYLMYLATAHSWWLPLLFVIPAAGFLVRTFIIFHDCVHGSFFQSRRANEGVGLLTGALTFMPFRRWRAEHIRHHATSGNLDKRGTGDIWTLTVEEYLASPWWRRCAYRIARNPIAMLAIAPLFIFVVQQRFAPRRGDRRERESVQWTNLIVAIAFGLCAAFGIRTYLLLQLSIMAVAGAAGVWLFYVQHQFEGVYWGRKDDWDYTAAALSGSSYYKLPAVLCWFTGNIGFHHIHHLSPAIRLSPAALSPPHPRFSEVNTLTMLTAFRSFGVHLWDEADPGLVGFAHVRALRRRQVDTA